ncbi:MAG TPA: DPP IV N-terminal domain-containing protein [Bacteroidota bacterium]|nr:DPP IV N-terminal domain-containing protein [Bacteroidota bacterium]
MLRTNLFVIVCHLLLLQTENASSQSHGDTLRIAYNVLYDKESDNYEIFVMNADGTGKKNISNWKGVDWVYYAYEDKLYFVSDRDTTHRMYFLYEMDADGKNVRKVCPFRLEDSWLSSRKSGKEFVVTGRKDGLRHTLYLIDKDGNILKQLTTDTTRYHNDPCFSPDGREIVFRYKNNRRDQTELDELWIMNDNGTNIRQLTRYPTEDTTSKWHDYHAGPPFWEPNSNVISYISMRQGNYSIFTIKPDGTREKQLTDNETNEGYHAWSPDGKMIAFDASDIDGNKYSIYLMNADGTGVKQLTNEYKFEQAPVFVKSPTREQ